MLCLKAREQGCGAVYFHLSANIPKLGIVAILSRCLDMRAFVCHSLMEGGVETTSIAIFSWAIRPKDDVRRLSPCDGTQASRCALTFVSDSAAASGHNAHMDSLYTMPRPKRLTWRRSVHRCRAAARLSARTINLGRHPGALFLPPVSATLLTGHPQAAAGGSVSLLPVYRPALGSNLFHCPHCHHRHWRLCVLLSTGIVPRCPGRQRWHARKQTRVSTDPLLTTTKLLRLHSNYPAVGTQFPDASPQRTLPRSCSTARRTESAGVRNATDLGRSRNHRCLTYLGTEARLQPPRPLHCYPAGALSPYANRCAAHSESFLFPVQRCALSRKFSGRAR